MDLIADGDMLRKSAGKIGEEEAERKASLYEESIRCYAQAMDIDPTNALAPYGDLHTHDASELLTHFAKDEAWPSAREATIRLPRRRSASLWISIPTVREASSARSAVSSGLSNLSVQRPNLVDDRGAVWDNLGQALLKQKKFDGAIDAYEAAISLNPRYDKFKQGLKKAKDGKKKANKKKEED